MKPALAWSLSLALSAVGAWAAYRAAQPSGSTVAVSPRSTQAATATAAATPATPATAAATPATPALPAPDPAAAVRRYDAWLATVAASSDGLTKQADLLNFIESLHPGELAAVFASSVADDVTRNLIAVRWAQHDPAGFLATLQRQHLPSLAEHDTKREVSDILFRTWAQQDPAAALAAAAGVADEYRFDGAVWSVISTVLERDAVAGLKMLTAHPDIVAGFTRVRGNEIQASQAADFVQAWAQLGHAATNDFRVQLRNTAFAKWTEQDAAGAIAWARTQPPAERLQLLPDAIATLAKKDLPAAQAALEALPPSLEREQAGPSVAVALLKEKPLIEVVAWVESALSGGRGEAMSRLGRSSARRDPTAALEFGQQLPPGSGRDQFLAAATDAWAEKDLTACATWVQTLPEGGERNQAVAAIGEQWIEQHPQSFADYILAAPRREVPEHLVYSAARALADEDPAGATTWALSLEGRRQTCAIYSIIGELRRNEQPAQLTSVLAQLPAGSTQDNAIGQALENYASFAPEAAATWLRTLPAGPLRRLASGKIAELNLTPAQLETWQKALNSP
jgi:hypothetical protein